MFAHTHIAVLIREHEGKAHLYHDERGMEIPYKSKSLDFDKLPETWVIFITENDVMGKGLI